MRPSVRIRTVLAMVVVSLLLLIAFTGTASAQTTYASEHTVAAATPLPHVNNVPNKVAADTSGCRSWTIYGKGWLPGDVVFLELDNASAQLGTAVADSSGNFAFPTSICGYGPGTHKVVGISEINLAVGTDKIIFL